MIDLLNNNRITNRTGYNKEIYGYIVTPKNANRLLYSCLLDNIQIYKYLMYANHLSSKLIEDDNIYFKYLIYADSIYINNDTISGNYVIYKPSGCNALYCIERYYTLINIKITKYNNKIILLSYKSFGIVFKIYFDEFNNIINIKYWKSGKESVIDIIKSKNIDIINDLQESCFNNVNIEYTQELNPY